MQLPDRDAMTVQNNADTIVMLTMFNYDLQFDPNTQVFILGIQMGRTPKRYHLMFGRLEFGVFAKALVDAAEHLKKSSSSQEGFLSDNGKLND